MLDRNKIISCPSCGEETEYSEENKFRPFCSKHCKTQDIAAWATEDYKVPSNEPVNEFDMEDALRELEENRDN